MPSTTPERRALIERWFGDESPDWHAMKFLESHGYREIANGVIRRPVPHHNMSEDEWECIAYLVQEWDFALEDHIIT